MAASPSKRWPRRARPSPFPTACPSMRRGRFPSLISRVMWPFAGKGGSRQARPCSCWGRRAVSGSPQWRSARPWGHASSQERARPTSARARRRRPRELRDREPHRSRDGADRRQGRRCVLRSGGRRAGRRRPLGPRLGRARAPRGVRGRRAADPRQSSPREEPLRPRLLPALLPLARARQSPALRGRAPRLVPRGQAQAVHQPSPAAGEHRGGDRAAHVTPGARQGGRASRNPLMEIRSERHGAHVVLVTIDNPPRLNAMTRAMLADLAKLWDELEASDCRCIVLTGAGTRAFSAGADISGDLSASAETARVVSHALLKYDAYSKPVVAAVNGDCVGGGLELLLSTDIRGAVPHARFGLPEVKWSIYPFGGATLKLTQQIGHAHAMDLLLTGRLIDAAEAARIGLINRVMPSEELVPWALATAEQIAANSPSAVQAVKRQISSTIAEHARAREAMEQALGDQVRASAHFKEGVTAFREKRRPSYE